MFGWVSNHPALLQTPRTKSAPASSVASAALPAVSQEIIKKGGVGSPAGKLTKYMSMDELGTHTRRAGLGASGGKGKGQSKGKTETPGATVYPAGPAALALAGLPRSATSRRAIQAAELPAGLPAGNLGGEP